MVNKIYITSIKESYSDDELEMLIGLLSEERRECLTRFHFREDQRRSLLGEVMVRINAGVRLGIRPEELCISRSQNGKPYFRDIPELHFSISHSGDWVVCMLSDQNCGIDIEKIGDARMDIAHRFFAEQEREMIRTVSHDRQGEVFTDLWTLKECYMKYDGRGLQMGLQNVQFEFCDGEYRLFSDQMNKLYFRQVDIIEGYKISMCMMSPEYEVQLFSFKEGPGLELAFNVWKREVCGK